MPGVSLRPSTFVEGGGAVPVDKNLEWKECKFHLFDYTTKAGEVVATTTAAQIHYVDEDGNDYEQEYSVGDPKRFIPSEDGKTLVALVEGSGVAKSSNFGILMKALVDAGYPENRLSEDITTLNGLKTHNIGMPEPTRSGLARPADPNARVRVISIPDQILSLPGEKGKKGAVKPAAGKNKGTAAVEADDSEAVEADTIAFVEKKLGDNDSVTRQSLAQAIFKDLAKNPNRDAVAALIFAPKFPAVLAANGLTLDGEDISKAE